MGFTGVLLPLSVESLQYITLLVIFSNLFLVPLCSEFMLHQKCGKTIPCIPFEPPSFQWKRKRRCQNTNKSPQKRIISVQNSVRNQKKSPQTIPNHYLLHIWTNISIIRLPCLTTPFKGLSNHFPAIWKGVTVIRCQAEMRLTCRREWSLKSMQIRCCINSGII